jgi:co-chaperonin GroES (HSP10)
MSTGMTYSAEKTNLDEDRASQLPDPAGYKLLVMLQPLEEKTDGGIIIPENRLKDENQASIVACVLKVGPDAYADKVKFPNGPWCKKGDWIILKSYAGIRLSIHDCDFRLINDDTVEGTIDDPRGVSRS